MTGSEMWFPRLGLPCIRTKSTICFWHNQYRKSSALCCVDPLFSVTSPVFRWRARDMALFTGVGSDHIADCIDKPPLFRPHFFRVSTPPVNNWQRTEKPSFVLLLRSPSKSKMMFLCHEIHWRTLRGNFLCSLGEVALGYDRISVLR